MSIEFIWQLPARGDGHYGDAAVRRRGERSSNEPAPLSPGVSDPRAERFNYFDHLHQIARAAELSGFDGVHIQHDPMGDESWIIAGYLVRGTRRLKLVTEFEASWGSSVYAAKNAASFQRYSAGRFAWHLQAGAASSERRKSADPVSDEDVLPRIGEFLQVARGVLTQAPFSFKGRFFEVQNGGFKDGLDHQSVPQVYWSVTSRAALELSAELADVHVLSPAPLVELSRTVQIFPSFPMTDEPWVISSVLARETRTFRFMIPFQPGFLNPIVAARMTASLQRATGGRALYNVITGGGGPQQLWWGDSVAHDDRYTRTTEFLDVVRGVWRGGPFSYQGKFYQVEDAGLPDPLSKEDFPEIYFSGSSDAALASASKHADFYLTWLEPFAQLRDKFARVREKTAALGRQIKCAVRVDIVARPTEEEAWAEIRRGFDGLSRETVEKFSGGPEAGTESVGARRQASNRPKTISSYKDLIVEPNVWSGFALLRGGQTQGILGSYEQVAERLDQLVELGTDAFILASTPHLEEAYRVGEEVLPLVKGRQASSLRAVG